MTSATIALIALAAVTLAIVAATAVGIYLERKGPTKMHFYDR